LQWGLLISLFCLAYVFFAAAFISIRLWLWASAALWARALEWRAALRDSPYERLLPRSLREPGVETRLAELVQRNREILEKYGWLP
jgi:hypothetical protein